MRRVVVICCWLVIACSSRAQENTGGKYPSLLWEITGKGLTRPSYLFGTMHVSSKMAFHLSDSFYQAMQHCDVVALELNPELWQRDMIRMEGAQQQVAAYMRGSNNEYLNEKSFRFDKYDDQLRAALTEDPAQINGLLYRTFQTQADYEENTYLDLYIYQTGRKLGKQPGGVEDYYQTEQTVFEAYQDMAKEKNRRRRDTEGELDVDIQQKIQDAYRQGNLDLLDSLEKLSFNSPAYLEKFLYRRNEVQAYSIDTILRRHSLFAGVGAAHLPGARGVIELLRKKGYRLRPILMQDRDGDKKEQIDQLKVPVVFHSVSTEDSLVSLQLPGPLYRRSEGRSAATGNSSWQYADMDNGAYYMLTRVRTHAALLGQPVAAVIAKLDSLLYENIPGKIIHKKPLLTNGYPGFDITNRTRRGDLQRYNILVTPFEVLVFKMSGNDNYVDGKEAETFFGSIHIREQVAGPVAYRSAAGFRVNFPAVPLVKAIATLPDKTIAWEYEAVEPLHNNAFAIQCKTIRNENFLEEDTFDLSLVEESMKGADLVRKELQRKMLKKDGYDALDMVFSLVSGGRLHALAVLRGTQYFVLAARCNDQVKEQAFFDSFHFTAYQYAAAGKYTDTLLHFSVNTPVRPVLDSNVVSMVSMAMSEEFLNQVQERYRYWPLEKYASFSNDTTGETITVQLKQYPRYYYSKDSASFWKKELEEEVVADWVVRKKEPVTLSPQCNGYRLEISDTNTVRKIIVYRLLNNDRLYRISTITDSLGGESSFTRDFFASFRPEENQPGPPVFQNKKDLFFADYYSRDSMISKRARSAISAVYFGPTGIDQLLQVIQQLKPADKAYFDLKSRFIAELGYINDSCCVQRVQQLLEGFYRQTADTSYFQNEVLQALARLKTTASFALLKNLLLQDPPVFENSYGYRHFFGQLEDSLTLARSLFPEILQLASIEDYRMPVTLLLHKLSDSNCVSVRDYESYYTKLYFDARIALKRTQGRDARLLEKKSRSEEDSEDVEEEPDTQDDLEVYAGLLLPFYNRYPAVQQYFDKLLRAKNEQVQLDAAMILARKGYQVPDSVLRHLAALDEWRARLYRQLENAGHATLFPAAYCTQELMARSLLLNQQARADSFFAIAPLGKQQVQLKGKAGNVYVFKYKLKKQDDWKIGLSGLQPAVASQVSAKGKLVRLTGKKLKSELPQAEQLQAQLKKLLFTQHKSAALFFENNSYTAYHGSYGDDTP